MWGAGGEVRVLGGGGDVGVLGGEWGWKGLKGLD